MTRSQARSPHRLSFGLAKRSQRKSIDHECHLLLILSNRQTSPHFATIRIVTGRIAALPVLWTMLSLKSAGQSSSASNRIVFFMVTWCTHQSLLVSVSAICVDEQHWIPVWRRIVMWSRSVPCRSITATPKVAHQR